MDQKGVKTEADPSNEEFAKNFIFNEMSGEPVQTRTGDLYRVKVAQASTSKRPH